MACDLNPSKVNRFFGWIIPPFLICVMGFTTWVYIVLICINYLIMHGRTIGITLLVIFSILLCMVTLSFTRIIFTPPGYVPRFKDLKLSSSNDVGLRTHIVNQMKTFCLYDAYVCENDGFPRWCAVCEVYKPDRAHHCSEVQRCVLKLDHFCPWVGGVIGFTRYKFFVLFIFYVTLICIFVICSCAPLTGEYRKMNGRVPGPWIGILALASFFTLFLGPFTSIHIFYILRNSTTIESINFYARIYLLNVLYETEKSGVKRANVTTKPGYHPWDLGWKMNWRSVMGKHWWDWFFPFTGSPGSGYHFDYNSELLDELKIMAKQSKVVSKYLSSDKSVTTLNLQSECSGVNSQYGFCTDGVLTSSTNS
ncbi:uncharacterized protein T551_02563 [Pneumocystis jirovecii RU7]|uniref:Palmitoyltransferase n=1 Tax=Pneumocystis jirovecii (strain RU7) TaxID=1408657 RepID=A0A0W4ZK26_PNEJ7|nr:uncharacterized protein T551_02563 [Pneumocystis jirovecii RU7]KTW28713.1 hypothetical protein T551_02563 [Pneumocystis jirovecii RU7]